MGTPTKMPDRETEGLRGRGLRKRQVLPAGSTGRSGGEILKALREKVSQEGSVTARRPTSPLQAPKGLEPECAKWLLSGQSGELVTPTHRSASQAPRGLSWAQTAGERRAGPPPSTASLLHTRNT